MKDNELLPVSIPRFMNLYPGAVHLHEDLVLLDFDSFRFPDDTRHMKCVFVGLCLYGSGSYTLGAVEHKFQANDVILIGEGQVMGDITKSADFAGEGMLISHNFLEGVISDIRNITNLFIFALENPVFHLTQNEALMFKDYYSLMRLKVESNSHRYRKEIVGTLLATLVYELCNAIHRTQNIDIKSGSRSEKIFGQFINLVEHNFKETRRVSWYSEQIGISPKSLLEMVKRVSNRTPNEWLDLYTTMEIRHLLRHTSMPIKEIADELNFGTQGSLGKFFKEQVGISPTNYRTT